MTSALCEKTILKLLDAYPFFRSEVLTTTGFGRPVQTLIVGEGDREVLFSASHHANEWITTPVLLKFAEELAEAIQNGGTLYGVPAQTILQYSTIHMVPMVDPDGVDLVTGAIETGTPEYETARNIAEDYPDIPFPDGWKANLFGVDLNLQYPAGWEEAREIKFAQGFTSPAPRDYVGAAPLDQPESRAVYNFTLEHDFRLTLSYHTQGNVIFWKYLDYEPPNSYAIGQRFARLSGYSLELTPPGSAYAGYKDWFIMQYNRPGYTMEVGRGVSPLPLSQFDGIYRANEGVLTEGMILG